MQVSYFIKCKLHTEYKNILNVMFFLEMLRVSKIIYNFFFYELYNIINNDMLYALMPR